MSTRSRFEWAPRAAAVALALAACSGGETEAPSASSGADEGGDGGSDLASDAALDAVPGGDRQSAPLPTEIIDFPLEDPTTYALHPTLKLPLSRTRVLLQARPGVAAPAMAALIAPLGARLTGATADALFLAEVPDPGDFSAVDALIGALRRAPEVEVASHDSLVWPDLAPGPWFAGTASEVSYQGIFEEASAAFRVVRDPSWGLELTRVPALWNLRGFIRRQELTLAGLGVAETPLPRVTVLLFDTFDRHDVEPSSHLRLTPFGDLPEAVEPKHGVAVASVLASTWGGEGMDGVVPLPIDLVAVTAESATQWEDVLDVTFTPTAETVPRTFAASLQVLGRALAFHAPVEVLNISQGFNWHLLGVNPNREATAAIRQEVCDEGRIFARIVNTALNASTGLVVTVSAGNEGGKFPLDPGGVDPNLQSPWACAIIDGMIPNGLVVGSSELRANGKFGIASHSNRPPDVFAPGQGIGILGSIAGEPRVSNGTSLAAPFVAGLAATLHLLKPGATAATIRDAILQHATPLVDLRDDDLQGLGVPHVDAFAPAMSLDPPTSDDPSALTMQMALVDTDDGTRDGCQRRTLNDDGTGLETLAAETVPAGDGSVDMRDFRRLRDANALLYEAEGGGLDALVDARGGLHGRMDLNGDGEQTRRSADAVVPPGRELIRWENLWSRFDFNGDGVFHPSLVTLPFKAQATSPSDLDVLAQVWGGSLCCGPPLWQRPVDLEGHGSALDTNGRAAMLRGLLRSADVEVRVGQMFEAMAPELAAVEAVEIHVWTAAASDEDEPPRGGSPADPARPDTFSERSRRVHRDTGMWPWQGARSGFDHRLVFTVPLPPPGQRVFARAYFVTDEADPSSWPRARVSVVPAVPGAASEDGDAISFTDLKAGSDRAVAFAAPAAGSPVSVDYSLTRTLSQNAFSINGAPPTAQVFDEESEAAGDFPPVSFAATAVGETHQVALDLAQSGGQYALGTLRAAVTRVAETRWRVELSAVADPVPPPLPVLVPACGECVGEAPDRRCTGCSSVASSDLTVTVTLATGLSGAWRYAISCAGSGNMLGGRSVAFYSFSASPGYQGVGPCREPASTPWTVNATEAPFNYSSDEPIELQAALTARTTATAVQDPLSAVVRTDDLVDGVISFEVQLTRVE